MAMNAKQRRHLIQQNQQDGNECQTKKTQQNQYMAMNAKQKRHLTQQKQQDGNECQTKKTLNTTKLVGWQ